MIHSLSDPRHDVSRETPVRVIWTLAMHLGRSVVSSLRLNSSSQIDRSALQRTRHLAVFSLPFLFVVFRIVY